jgi:hypothetical protein
MSTTEASPCPHVMVDLETMGTVPGSAILSIGAVAFDPIAGTMGDSFYDVISLQSCFSLGLSVDASTVLWWLQQSDAARAEFRRPNPSNLREALCAFTGWWGYRNPRCIWSHGANFDEPLLAAAFRAASLTLPWRYADVRCTRTIFDLTGERPDRGQGTHHNALDDAKAQAGAVIRCYAKLGLQRA